MPFSDFSAYCDYSKMPMPGKNGANNTWFWIIIKGIAGLSWHGDLLLINKSNSNLIQRHLKTNPDYNLRLDEIVFNHLSASPTFSKNNRDTIITLLRMVDLINSTNLWRMKGQWRQALLNIADYIVTPSNDFWTKLSEGPKKNALVDDLTTAALGKKGINEGVEASSFASKVCRHFDWLFNKSDDRYYLNDSVVRQVLPYYLNYYGVKIDINKFRYKWKGQYYYHLDYSRGFRYGDLYNCLEALKKASDPSNALTKTEFDQLMWYCYRYENI